MSGKYIDNFSGYRETPSFFSTLRWLRSRFSMANAYARQFNAAWDLLDKDECEKCIAEAKKNLR